MNWFRVSILLLIQGGWLLMADYISHQNCSPANDLKICLYGIKNRDFQSGPLIVLDLHSRSDQK